MACCTHHSSLLSLMIPLPSLHLTGVNVNGANALNESLMDIGEMAIVEPQSQQPGEDAYSMYDDMPAGSTCIESSL